MEPFEIDTPHGLSGLQIGASRAEVRAYFGKGWESLRDASSNVPADLWRTLGVTAFYTESGKLFYLALERDNVRLKGHRLNAMHFAAACAAVEALFPDTGTNSDLTASPSARLAVLRSEHRPERTGATCLFADGFEDIWMEAAAA